MQAATPTPTREITHCVAQTHKRSAASQPSLPDGATRKREGKKEEILGWPQLMSQTRTIWHEYCAVSCCSPTLSHQAHLQASDGQDGQDKADNLQGGRPSHLRTFAPSQDERHRLEPPRAYLPASGPSSIPDLELSLGSSSGWKGPHLVQRRKSNVRPKPACLSLIPSPPRIVLLSSHFPCTTSSSAFASFRGGPRQERNVHQVLSE